MCTLPTSVPQKGIKWSCHKEQNSHLRLVMVELLYVPSSMLGAEDSAMNKRDSVSSLMKLHREM